MEYKKYRVGDLKERIRENAEKSKSVSKISVLESNETKNEFEPVFGKNVDFSSKLCYDRRRGGKTIPRTRCFAGK